MVRFRRKTSTRSRSGIDQVGALITSIHDALTGHDITLVRRGTAHLPRVEAVLWDPGQDVLTCVVGDGEGQEYTVTMEQSPDCREILAASCNCPASNNDELCEHTYAVLRRFEERLHLSRDPLKQRLFGIEDQEDWTSALANI